MTTKVSDRQYIIISLNPNVNVKYTENVFYGL